ncbi:MAG: cytochrome c [Pseudomonadota bacterium]
MWRRAFALIVVAGVGTGFYLTHPSNVPADYGANLTPDASAGALVFHAAGCASCHVSPNDAPAEHPILAGGLAFPSDFGTFYAPNISSDREHGIGSWTQAQFARAVTVGVSPQGQHYYPAFPYGAYQHMTPQDAVDLHAYVMSLPASPSASQAHDVGFPFNIRRGLGLWKRAFISDSYGVDVGADPVLMRGQYLAEGLAHCAECHTPRNAVGGLDRTRWMAGAPNPSGKGTIPNITPAALEWSERDLVEYFTSGFTPDYDSAGGEMAEVVENLSKLPETDRAAIAAYIKALPAVATP